MRRLPGAHDDLADAPHGLAVRRHHAERAEVVQDILGGDRLPADARLGEGHVLGDRRIQVMAHHEHVEVLVQRIDRVRARRIGARGQDVQLAARADDVRRVAAAGTLRVIGVDGAALEGSERVSTKPDSLSVSVWIATCTSISSATARQLSMAAGVVPQSSCSFRPMTPGRDLLPSGLRRLALPLPSRPKFIGNESDRLQHAVDVPRARRAGRGRGPGRGAGAAADHGRDAGVERLLDLLRADHVNVRIDASGRYDHALARDDLGRRADHDVDAGLNVGIAGLADGADATVLDADVGFDDAPVIDDQRVGDHRVGHVAGAALALPHAVADHLAAAELHLLAVDGVVLLDLDPQIGVRQAGRLSPVVGPNISA